MSADNWAICPRCKLEYDARAENLKREIAESYGKVSPESYLTLLERSKNADPVQMPETFREDYELGVEPNGEFYVSYGGSCETCGLEFRYNYKTAVDLTRGRRKSA